MIYGNENRNAAKMCFLDSVKSKNAHVKLSNKTERVDNNEYSLNICNKSNKLNQCD